MQAGDRTLHRGLVETTKDAGPAHAWPAIRRAPPQPAARRTTALVVAAVILAGMLQRWWAAAHPIGTLSSDGAVIGLMALRLLDHGQLTAYMWGQSYGGSLEAVLTAAVFAIAGTGVGQLIAATAFSSALSALALWRAGRRIAGEPAAAIGALVFWVWPATFLWRSLKPGGTYMIGLAIALCAVGALARVRQGDDGWRRCGLAGLWCGLALWSSPVSVELLVPAALWCFPALRRLGRRLIAVTAGAVIGAAPALWFGATHDWLNLHVPGRGPDLFTGIATRFGQFFTIEAPIGLGVRVEGSFAWVGGYLGEILARAAAVALLATAWTVASGRAPRCLLPVLTLALVPFIYAVNSLADHTDSPGRYALFAVPMVALLVGVGIERTGILAERLSAARSGWPVLARGEAAARLVWTAGIALACALGTVGLVAEPGRELVAFPAPDVTIPVNDSALQRLLALHEVKDAYATYWIAYRVMFETGGSVTVTPYDHVRYPPIAASVNASPDPAYVFVSASQTAGSFEKWCRERRVGYQAWTLGSFTVVQPSAKVTPDAVRLRPYRAGASE